MLSIFKKDKIEGMTLGEVGELLGWLRVPTGMVSTPVNLRKEKEKFLSSNTYNPLFKYELIRNTNDRILGTLEDVVQVIDVDPAISDFYIDLIKSKKQANDLMYSVGDNDKFTRISKERFKAPSHILFKNASRILRGKIDGYDLISEEQAREGDFLEYKDISKAFEVAFEELELYEWTVNESKNIKRGGLKVGIKSKEVFMSPSIRRRPMRLRKTLVHELTHIIRAYNGSLTGYEALSKPTLSSYLDIEEGLAGYNEEMLGLMSEKDLRNRAAKTWAIYMGERLTFRELYNACLSFVPKPLAWAFAYSAKKGLGDTSKPGVNTRDVAYFRGFRRVRRKLASDKSLYEKLYAGKIDLKRVKWVDDGLIKKPKLVLDKRSVNKIFKKAGI